MGKWKYINWLIVVIILAHMYYYISHRYDGPPLVYVLSTAGWLVMALLGYYVFVYRISRPRRSAENPLPEKQLPKPGVKERPKVTFRKKDEH